MSRPHPALLRLAQGLIAAGVLLGLLAFATRAMDARAVAVRALEGGALLSAAAAYLAHLPRIAHRRANSSCRRAWSPPSCCGPSCNSRRASAVPQLLNDGAIVLFVADLAFVLMPWRLTEQP